MVLSGSSSGSLLFSLVLVGSQWLSKVLSVLVGPQWFSVVLVGSQWFS